MNTQFRIQRMLRASGDVLVHPQERVFRRYAAQSSDSEALTYVAIATFVVVILQMLIAQGGSAMVLLLSVVNQLFNFYIFAGVAHFVGKQQGGLGNFDEIAYTFALFYVPIIIATWLLSWGILFVPLDVAVIRWFWVIEPLRLAAQVFYGHLAVKGVMGFRRRREPLIAVVAAIIALWVLELIFSRGALSM